MKYIILNQKLILEGVAHISPQDRGFRYGDGVFETILISNKLPHNFGVRHCEEALADAAIHNDDKDWIASPSARNDEITRKLYQWEFHVKRLKAALTATRIEFDTNILPALCGELLTANKCSEGLLRIQITRGIGGRGYLPERGISPTLLIETMAIPTPPPAPISLFLSSYAKISQSALPVNFKLCQGLNSTLARMEAADNNCFDALILNDAGQICETSSANIFWLKNGILYTPSLACGVVEGSIRNAVIRTSPYPVQEVAENLEVFALAEAVFITNVAYKILPVFELKPLGISWNSSKLAIDVFNI